MVVALGTAEAAALAEFGERRSAGLAASVLGPRPGGKSRQRFHEGVQLGLGTKLRGARRAQSRLLHMIVDDGLDQHRRFTLTAGLADHHVNYTNGMMVST